MTLLSVFGGGLFIIPILTILGAVIFGFQAYKAHNSNSTTTFENGTVEDNTGNVPYTEIGQFWFSVILTVATVAILLIMIAEK